MSTASIDTNEDANEAHDEHTSSSSDDALSTSAGSAYMLEIWQTNLRDVAPISYRRATLLTQISKFFGNGCYTDVTIESNDGRFFMCHRIVLAASSKYFDQKFAENVEEGYNRTIPMADVDSGTFKRILRFMYQGEIVAIDDDNVFDLLRASDFLKLREIELHCVHYLIQKCIPAGSVLSKSPLDHFCGSEDLKNISKDYFETRLRRQKGSSVDEEADILNTIFRWVLRSDEIRNADKRSYFVDIVRWTQFKFIPDADKVLAEYLENSVVDMEAGEVSRSESSDHLVSDSVSTRTDVLSMHLYLGTDVKLSSADGRLDRPTTSVFSLKENAGINWHLSRTIEPPIEKMRVVEVNDRLYSLKLSDDRWTFSSSADVDLATDVQFLDLPASFRVLSRHQTRNSLAPFSLCCLRGCVFVSGLNCDLSFIQEYNVVLGEWFSHQVNNVRSELKIMTSDGTRLYLIFRQPPYFGSQSEFVALDPRMKRGVLLNCQGFNYISSCTKPPCFHDGRFYLLDDESSSAFRIAVYDLRANRWDINSLGPNFLNQSHGCRLASFNDRLWMFILDYDSSCIYTYIYNSRTGTWSDDYLAFCALDSALTRSNLRSTDFIDVVVF